MTDEKKPERRSLPFELDGKPEETRASDGSPTLTFEGYAAVFGEPAVVTDWRGTFREQFAPTSFDRTLQLRSRTGDQVRQIKFLFDHGAHPLIANMPIGHLRSVRPDSRGLFVRARMPVNWLNQPIIDGIRSGAISGMSINFIAEDDAWETDSSTGVRSRTVREASLLELGPVLDPVYVGTEVSLRSLSAHLRKIDPDLFSGTADSAPAAAEEPRSEGPSTLETYKRLLERRMEFTR